MQAQLLTTPPPPSSDVLAAFTMHVVASLVISARMREILELRDEEDAGRVEEEGGGDSSPFL